MKSAEEWLEYFDNGLGGQRRLTFSDILAIQLDALKEARRLAAGGNRHVDSALDDLIVRLEANAPL